MFILYCFIFKVVPKHDCSIVYVAIYNWWHTFWLAYHTSVFNSNAWETDLAPLEATWALRSRIAVVRIQRIGSIQFSYCFVIAPNFISIFILFIISCFQFANISPPKSFLKPCYINGWDFTFLSNQSTDEAACLSNVSFKQLPDNFYFLCGFTFPSVLLWKSFITSEMSFDVHYVDVNFIVSIFSIRNLEWATCVLVVGPRGIEWLTCWLPTQFSVAHGALTLHTRRRIEN